MHQRIISISSSKSSTNQSMVTEMTQSLAMNDNEWDSWRWFKKWSPNCLVNINHLMTNSINLHRRLTNNTSSHIATRLIKFSTLAIHVIVRLLAITRWNKMKIRFSAKCHRKQLAITKYKISDKHNTFNSSSNNYRNQCNRPLVGMHQSMDINFRRTKLAFLKSNNKHQCGHSMWTTISLKKRWPMYPKWGLRARLFIHLNRHSFLCKPCVITISHSSQEWASPQHLRMGLFQLTPRVQVSEFFVH